MKNVRLIFEQIEVAKQHLSRRSILDYRLALVLLDNVAELLLYRSLELRFAWDEQLTPKWEPARSQWLAGPGLRRYTDEERSQCEEEFEPKLRFCHRVDEITDDERVVLSVAHKLRNEAFHRGTLRENILAEVVQVLFVTVVGLAERFPVRAFVIPYSKDGPDAGFLARFGLHSAMDIANDAGRKTCADYLRAGIEVDHVAVAEILSADLAERLDATVGSLYEMSDANTDAEIDRNIQYTQFWRDEGTELAKQGVREPDLEVAYIRWQSAGRAKYTLNRLNRWRRQAEAIARGPNAARALSHYWGIEKRFKPFEADVSEALFEYEERLDAEGR